LRPVNKPIFEFMTMPTRPLLLSAATLLSASALAQETAPTPENLMTPGWQNAAAPLAVQTGLNYTYDAPGAAKFQGARLGRSDASTVDLGVDTRLRVNDAWFVPLGLQADNYFLDAVGGAPIPDDIHTLHLRTGLGWRMNDQWTFTGLAGPSLYRMSDVHGDGFGAFGGFLATYRANPAYTWTLGLMASPDNDVPVLPVVGLHWQINDQYTLEVGVPKTRLTYRLDSQWSLYTGLAMNGTVFRADEDLGTKTGFPQYNNALATYRDIRLGAGAGYELGHGLRAEIEAGYSVYRRIDYQDIGQEVDFDPAPYVRLGLSYRF